MCVRKEGRKEGRFVLGGGGGYFVIPDICGRRLDVLATGTDDGAVDESTIGNARL